MENVARDSHGPFVTYNWRKLYTKMFVQIAGRKCACRWKMFTYDNHAQAYEIVQRCFAQSLTQAIERNCVCWRAVWDHSPAAHEKGADQRFEEPCSIQLDVIARTLATKTPITVSTVTNHPVTEIQFPLQYSKDPNKLALVCLLGFGGFFCLFNRHSDHDCNSVQFKSVKSMKKRTLM